jgi:hypothetical protein
LEIFGGTVAGFQIKPSAFAGGTATDISVKLASNPFNVDFAGSGAGGPEMKLSGVVDLAVPSVRESAAESLFPCPTALFHSLAAARSNFILI